MPLDSTPAAGDAVPQVAQPAAPASEDAPEEARPLSWKTNLVMFLATTVSMFYAGTFWAEAPRPGAGRLERLVGLLEGWPFAVPLLAILLVHEFGHYFAARAHRVHASLPFFLPLPEVSPFGTLGAVIAMKDRIKSRNALLDIGASGPLAGLVVAIPVLVIGLALSEVRPVTGPGLLEGQSLLYVALKRIVLGPIPDGHDVFIGPVAVAGWAGLLVTMLNLLPVGQLDGGHIAYALFGPKQNRYARVVHFTLLGMFAFNLVKFLPGALKEGTGEAVETAFLNSWFWLIWFGLLVLLRRVGGRDHPPTEPGELSPARKAVAVLSLAFFVLLFMPTPWSIR